MQYWRVVILGLALLVNSALCASSAFGAPQIIDQVVAVVDDAVVLKSEVDNMLCTIKKDAQKANQQLPDDATLRRQILDRLIMENIILQLARRANVVISDEQLDQVIGNIAYENHMSIDQLRRYLSHNGIDYNTYRAQICKEMLIAEVRNREIRRRITILPREVESLTKQIASQISNSTEFNLSHILIPLPENSTQDQLNRAEALVVFIIEQSNNGADFDKLAVTYSANTQELKSGQMGWNKLEMLPSIFTKHLQRAKKNSIIGPIISGAGFHILKVNDIRERDQRLEITEVHARHILICTSVLMTDQQAYAKLKDIAAQIKSGRIGFSTAARQLSEDPNSSNQGGDLGWISVDAFDPILRHTLIHLKKGEISEPVHSSFGWHLIQLIDTRQVDHTSAAHKDRAYRLLFNRKFADESQTWMQEHRAAAYVKILDKNGQ